MYFIENFAFYQLIKTDSFQEPICFFLKTNQVTLVSSAMSECDSQVAPQLTRQFPTQKGIYILFVVICFDYVDFQFKKLYL